MWPIQINLKIRAMCSRRVLFLLLCACSVAPAFPFLSARNTDEYYVRTLSIDGTGFFVTRRLREMMEMNPRPFSRVTYRRSVLQNDVRRIRAYYVSKGHVKSRVSIDSIQKRPATRGVRIELSVKPGPLTRIAHIRISTNGALDLDSLRKQISADTGKVLTSQRIMGVNDMLANLCARRNLLEARVSHQISFVNDSLGARVHFMVDEGPVIVTDSVRLNGLEKVRPSVVRHEIRIYPGEVLTREGIRNTVSRLYATDLFSLVYVDYRDTESDNGMMSTDTVQRDVRISLTEARYLRAQTSVGFHTHENIRARAETSYDNVFSAGYRVGVQGELNFVRWTPGYMAQGGIEIPLRTSYDLEWSEQVSFRRENEVNYSGRFVSIDSRVSAALSNSVEGYTRHRWERALIDTITTVADTQEYGQTNSISSGVVHDTRDNTLDPSGGRTASFDVDFAGLSGRKGNQFIRTRGLLTKYLSLSDGIILATGLRAGIAFTHGSTEVLPVQERFYLGGADVMRGYRYHALRTESDSIDGAPAGGDLFVACNLVELRMQWWGVLGGVLFFDAGGVWNHENTGQYGISYDTFTKGLRFNPGAGLRVETFIGVLRADCGLQLNARIKKDFPLAVHVGIGQAF